MKRGSAKTGILFFLLLLVGCGERPETGFQGYVEGDFVLVAAPLAGRLDALAVRRGVQVAEGDPLFTLEAAEEAAAVAAAEQGVAQAQNRLADLRKGVRPSELASLQARLRQARASLDLSRQELARRQDLFRQQMVSAEELDRARAAVARDEAAVRDLQAQLTTARLGGRSDQIKAAEAEVEAARRGWPRRAGAGAEEPDRAPGPGWFSIPFIPPGEFVPAGYPVVSLLPPGQVKLRFFVPETVVGTLKPGQPVSFSFDGAPDSHRRHVSYISPQAEYTPPVIYSRETRRNWSSWSRPARPGRGREPPSRPTGGRAPGAGRVSDSRPGHRGQRTDQVLRRQDGGQPAVAPGRSRVRSTVFSARTAAARPPSSACSAACCAPMPAAAPAWATTSSGKAS